MQFDKYKPLQKLYVSKYDMPQQCYECSLSTACQHITHLPPDFNATDRPHYCPLQILPYRKLRLIVNTDCNRHCQGCCNNDWNFKLLPTCNDYTCYDKIMITGGEPLLHPDNVLTVISEIRKNNPIAEIILYTATTKHLDRVLPALDGLTLTLHEQSDVQPFLEFDKSPTLQRMSNIKSLRLNVFKDITLPDHLNGTWKIHKDKVWIKDCPLPENEILAKWHGCN